MTKRFANFYELAEIFSFFSYTQRWPVRYGTGTGTAPSKGKLSQTALHFSVSYHLNTYVLDSINFLNYECSFKRAKKLNIAFPDRIQKSSWFVKVASLILPILTLLETDFIHQINLKVN